MKYYRYLYYKIFSGISLIRIKGDPDLRAFFGLSVNEGMNVYSLSQIFVYFIYNNEIRILGLLIGAVTLVFFIVNYFLFIYKDKYKKIIDEFKNESDKKRKIGTILTWSYVIVTLALLFYAKHLQFS